MNQVPAWPLQWPAGWPRTAAAFRQAGAFKGTHDKVRRELLREIDAIALGREALTHTIGSYVVISTNCPLRKDGFPRADFRPNDPGVAVYFPRQGKPACFAADKYDEVWKNMRSIQLTIGALRGIERWGSSQMLDRAFTGFAALPPKSGPDCWEELGLAGSGPFTEEQIVAAYRAKALEAHPDRGGSHEAFTSLTAAKDIALATIKHL